MKSFTTSITTFLERLILSVMVFTVLTAFVPSMSFAIQPPATTRKVILLIDQAKSTYLKSMGMDFNAALNQHPDSLAAAMGLALQRQRLYIEKNPDPVFQYSQLRRQATDFLGEVAQAHNYRHPINGTPMDKDYLEEILIENAAGFFNDAFIKKYGINPAMVELPLLIGDKPVQNNIQRHDAFQQEENNDIILFGEKIKAAKDVNVYPETTSNEVPPDDIIVGNWIHEGKGWNNKGKNRTSGTVIKTANGYQADIVHIVYNTVDNKNKITKRERWQINLDHQTIFSTQFGYPSLLYNGTITVSTRNEVEQKTISIQLQVYLSSDTKEWCLTTGTSGRFHDGMPILMKEL